MLSKAEKRKLNKKFEELWSALGLLSQTLGAMALAMHDFTTQAKSVIDNHNARLRRLEGADDKPQGPPNETFSDYKMDD